MKTCIKCHKELESNMFYKHPGTPDGLDSRCKSCHKIMRDQNYQDNKEKILARQKQYKIENPDKVKSYIWNQPQKKSEYNKEYRLENRDKLNENCRQYHKKNFETLKIKKKKYIKERLKNDPAFKLRKNTARRIIYALQGIDKSDFTLNLLGCSCEFFREYIEKQFTQDMSWDNYGNHGWNLDHIIPVSHFNLLDPEQQKKAFHHTNCRPLWATTKIARQHGDFEREGNFNKNASLTNL